MHSKKFINPKVTGAKKKEAIRQEKKKVKSELRNKANEERVDNETKYGVVTKESKERTVSNKEQESRIKIPININKGAGSQENRADRTPARRSSNEAPQKRYTKEERTPAGSPAKGNRNALPPVAAASTENELMPLNKYVAHAGVCARREAAILVKDGHVKVNGDIVYEPGYKVSAKDKVEVKGKPVFLQKNLVYILINKPKDYITTAKDPEGRKTVFELVANATKERIYPVGRLDRNTTGVLLMTNDGELAQKLTHPSYEIKKVYEVKLDKPLTKKDAEAIMMGVTLEDGLIKADAVGYADTKDKSVIGIEIHSGRNRIVRRLFEFLGYDVKNLDRVMFANLTKKNVDRGKWRLLTEKEVRLLKYMNQSFLRSKKSD